MGGGDLNAKKAWHPNTLKNQERVWKAEQAAAEEKKRIVELERERHLERERSELNKLAKSNVAHSGQTGDDRLHWMYEKPDKKVQQEEYLLGKAIDKSHEQAGKTEADEIPAVSRRVVGSSMLTASGDTQVDLVRKMREDPLLLVKERERAARAALLNNPVQRAKLTELLRKEQAAKNESKSKKKNKKSKDLDDILAEKLQALSSKKGIDLASLLASDDSSSESSDEKSKKKKKKKKKSKSKNVTSYDSDVETQKHKSKYDSNSESKKVKKQNRETKNDDSDHGKRKKRHQFTENETAKSHVRKHRKNSSEDRSSDDNQSEQQKQNSKYITKNVPKKYDDSDKSKKADTTSDNFHNTRKRRQHSTEKESAKSHVKKHYKDSSKEHHSSDDQQSTDNDVNKRKKNYVKEDRYWNNKQYSNEYRPKDDKYARTEGHSKEKDWEDNRHRHDREDRQRTEREDRHRESVPYRDNKHSLEDGKYKKEGGSGSNVAGFDKSRQSNKRSGLSEAEKASKLAEMIAAGAEREKQRERRVADQLAEKEKEERPNTHSRSRNIVRQLPESLESRIHSNRHYIQRDQRHMNENFARR